MAASDNELIYLIKQPDTFFQQGKDVLAQGLGGVGVLQTAQDFLGMSSRDLRMNVMLVTTSP